LARDWRFRENQWKRRARLAAREIRDGDASNYETFSPTTPLAVVKMLIVMSLLHGLSIASVDVGDAFLQVPQTPLVLIEVPLWALHSGEVGNGKRFWVLKRCLPGQRVAASEWNKFFTEICERHSFESFQGTIFRHKKQMAFISAHIDDLLIVDSKKFINNLYKELPKELRLKIEGLLQPGDDGSIFYLKRELQFNENGIDVSPSSRYIPKLAELLKVYDRRGRTAPHHGCLQIYDPEATAEDQYLNAEDAKLSRSALGICIYVTL